MRQRRRSAVLSAVAAVAVAVLVAPAAEGTFPGRPGKIAVATCGGVDCGVSLVDPAGSGATRLTHNPNQIPLPRGGRYPAPDTPSSWTPDGRSILYLRAMASGGPERRIVNADGTGDQLFPAAPRFQPVFSPDGSKVAYVEFIPPGDPQIFVRNIDGTGVQQLTQGQGPGSGSYDPDWSPDGTKIAFSGSGRVDIHVMNADGTGQRRLLNSATLSGRDPSWSPDGSKIAFTGNTGGGNYDIFVINSDGSGLVNLTDNYVGPPDYTRIDDEEPAWSPDGTQIAFVRRVGNPLVLHVMDADGAGAHEVLGAGSSVSHPVWQSIPAPRRGDYKNASHFCKAEREFLGDEAFRARYGGGSNAHGRCVSRD